MSKTYTRLTEDGRYQIYEGVTEKRSHREIARLMNKHHSAASREMKRNTGLRGYRPKQAQDKALERHQSKAKYKKRTGSPDARSPIIGRGSIDERPSIVDDKVRLGDWEADTVIGKGHGNTGRTGQ